MEGQAQNNTYNAGAAPGQAQMRREWDGTPNQQSDQNNFLQEAGSQVKNVAQGAADVGKGTVQGAVSLARGAALGAANLAQGAADVVKNTIGGTTTNTASNNNVGGGNHRGNANMDLEGSTYPGNPGYPNNKV